MFRLEMDIIWQQATDAQLKVALVAGVGLIAASESERRRRESVALGIGCPECDVVR
jgi:hypothetical protein